jgi:hypothetical protein
MSAEHALVISARLFWDNPCSIDVHNTIDDQFRELLTNEEINAIIDEDCKGTNIFKTIGNKVKTSFERYDVKDRYTKKEVYLWFEDMLTGCPEWQQI